uniref:Uncharacterized protein n=1 Tax=Lepeophtheirus salmonis TaxID=72036 RepID=A0A0K2T7G2_LEPSM
MVKNIIFDDKFHLVNSYELRFRTLSTSNKDIICCSYKISITWYLK